jgi:DNA polymerase-4
VTLKYRDEDFHTTTHARTLPESTDSGNTIFRLALELFAETHRGRKVRLLGIYTSHFGDATPQLGLFDEPRTPSPADRVRDEVRKRFGDEAITRASLLGRRERRNPSDKPPR